MSPVHEPASATIEALLIEAERGSLFDGVVKELRSLHHRNVVRLIDVIIVARRADGTIESHGSTELASEEVRELQSMLTRTLGFRVGNQDFGPNMHWEGASVLLGVEDVNFMADQLQPGQAALAVVFEHRWSTRLDSMIHRKGVTIVEDDMITTAQLAAAEKQRHH
ncbi:MAG TPA: hypothetical protein VFR33_08255 [Candidatus Dormibacteraeota bacterium]|nr:hypothetical protein [Candidatus Dormibacteraeota bacterium]